MAWTIEFQSSAINQLQKLDRTIQKRILTFFRQRVLAAGNPRQLGKALKGDRAELWRYRIGDYRAICKIEDEKLVVLVVEVGHRKQIYR